MDESVANPWVTTAHPSRVMRADRRVRDDRCRAVSSITTIDKEP